MRIAICLSAVLATLLLPGIGLALEANEIFKRTDPGVVVIVAEGAKRADDRLVSGVLVEPLEIVTICRGVIDAARLTVKQGSVQRSARLRFQDAARDLCQLRLDDAFPSAKPVTNFVLSKELEVGQPVFAIGSPRGLEHTISRGIVSALREMKEEVGSLVQTDAAISPGSSGGGLFDSEGRLVGIITFGFKDAQNLNFALPAEWVQELPKRNRDRLQGKSEVGADAKTETNSAYSPAAPGWMPKVGDRWIYQQKDYSRTIGKIVFEVVAVSGDLVRERITREGWAGFVAERDVSLSFQVRRFLDIVKLPGGYQFSEISPYASPELDIKPGQTWSDIPGTIYIPFTGTQRFVALARAVKKENIRVPAGTFDAWRIEVDAVDSWNARKVTQKYTYWYSPELLRTVKMIIDVNPEQQPHNLDTYELVSFKSAN
jgi:serine protease Do